MTLTQLRYLIAIADCGLCTTRAADLVRTTPLALLRQVKLLEEQLGFRLFVRDGHSLKGTSPAGEHVLTYARSALVEICNIRTFAANERGEREGRLRIVTSHTEACYVLPPAIATINREYPKVNVDLQVVDEDDVQRRIEWGDTDIALISTAGSEPKGGLAVPLFRWRRVVLVPRAHPLGSLKRAPTLSELATHPLISYECSHHPFSSLRVAFAHEGTNPQVVMTTRDDHLIKTYVRAGLGIGLLAEMAIRRPQDADLRVMSAPVILPECTSWAVLPRGRVLQDYAIALLHGLAPQLDCQSLRRSLTSDLKPNWPMPPSWAELRRSVQRPEAAEAM